ncbi:hypothetical protein HDU98_005953 [Podochytrium sp. JEL0797]|nr:hypothetical protein HDU98_005953 [Podochytrium sp. JEL0797]
MLWEQLWNSGVVLVQQLEDLAKDAIRESTPSAPRNPLRILELGCGRGLGGLAAAAMFPSASVVLTDASEESLRAAENAIAVNNLQNCSTKVLNWYSADLPTGEFDLIIASDVLYLGRAVKPVATLIAKMLAPNGLALVVDPDRCFAEDFEDRLLETGLTVERRILDRSSLDEKALAASDANPLCPKFNFFKLFSARATVGPTSTKQEESHILEPIPLVSNIAATTALKKAAVKSHSPVSTLERRVRDTSNPNSNSNKKDSDLMDHLNPHSLTIKKKRNSKTLAAEAIRKLAELEDDWSKEGLIREKLAIASFATAAAQKQTVTLLPHANPSVAQPWEHYAGFSRTPTLVYKVEHSKSAKSTCCQRGKRRSVKTRPFRRARCAWEYPSCWRIASIIWKGLPDPDVVTNPQLFADALDSMNGLVFCGFSELTKAAQDCTVAHVIDKSHWAKLCQNSDVSPDLPQIAAVAAGFSNGHSSNQAHKK